MIWAAMLDGIEYVGFFLISFGGGRRTSYYITCLRLIAAQRENVVP